MNYTVTIFFEHGERWDFTLSHVELGDLEVAMQSGGVLKLFKDDINAIDYHYINTQNISMLHVREAK